MMPVFVRVREVSRVKLQVLLVSLILAGYATTGVAETAVRVEKDAAAVEYNYNMSCATCHNAGVAGAPKMGDTAAWESRITKGMDALYDSVIYGMPPAMPQKGMCFSCSDDDLKALVDYMVDSVR